MSRLWHQAVGSLISHHGHKAWRGPAANKETQGVFFNCTAPYHFLCSKEPFRETGLLSYLCPLSVDWETQTMNCGEKEEGQKESLAW